MKKKATNIPRRPSDKKKLDMLLAGIERVCLELGVSWFYIDKVEVELGRSTFVLLNAVYNDGEYKRSLLEGGRFLKEIRRSI